MYRDMTNKRSAARRSASIRFVDRCLKAIHKRLGIKRSVTSADRRRLRVRWFKNAIDFCERAAMYLDGYQAILPKLPFSGDDLREAIENEKALEFYVHALESEAQCARDALLVQRAEIVGMGRDVMRALQWVTASPCLDGVVRGQLLGSLKILRKEHDKRNAKVAEGVARSWPGRRAKARRPPPIAAPEIIDVEIESEEE